MEASFSPVRTLALRLLPLLIFSAVPWAVLEVLIRISGPADLEGALVLAALAGAFTFIVIGPAIGLVLSRYVSEGKLGLLAFLALFLAVSAPTLSYQVVAISTSVIGGFAVGGPWHINDWPREMEQTALIATGWYLIYAFVLYVTARMELSAVKFAALVLGAFSFLIIAMKLF